MFGTNPISRPVDYVPGTYKIQEVFYTIQGEGPFAGLPAVFIRLRGCNLRCSFCDTDFDSGTEDLPLDELVARVSSLRARADLVVITGGEPMLQHLGPLCQQIVDEMGMRVQVETAGTVWPTSFDDAWILDMFDRGNIVLVCSPKTGSVHSMVEDQCRNWKYIISASHELSEDDGLPKTSTQGLDMVVPVYRPPGMRFKPDTIWVQPCDEYAVERAYAIEGGVGRSRVVSFMRRTRLSETSAQLAAKIAMQFGYRLTVQMHKMVGVP